MPLGKRMDGEQPTPKTQPVPADVDDTFELFQSEEPKYSFDDIILNDTTYDAIQDILVLYDKRELLFNEWGLNTTHKYQNRAGINLYGYSGTGKSMAAHAIANQLNRRLLIVDYSQIESKYVGETSKNLANMFKHATETQSLIFFDEADALLSRRVTNMTNSTDVSVNQTRSVLLLLLNDFDDMVLFATNFITNYDPAFMRRIVAHIKFDLPNEQNRLKLWRLYIPEPMPTNVDINKLASEYDNVSGSDISTAVFNASLRAARLNEQQVDHEYFEESIKRIIASKIDNDNIGTISRRTVSEEYVKSQFGGELPK